MNNSRIAFALAVATAVGAGTAFVVPAGWLQYCFWGTGLAALVFGSLAAASARDVEESNAGPAAKLFLWLVIGTDRPAARIKDLEAVVFFCGALAFLAGLTLGAFGAVHV